MIQVSQREIKRKNIFMVYLLFFATFGVYSIVWTVKSKRDINALGGDVPTSWLLLVPFANFYWIYKYCEGFSNHVKKDESPLLHLCIYLFAGFLTPLLVQSELNKFANSGKPSQESSQLKMAA